MSSPVTTFQALGMTAQPAVPAAVSVTDVPVQLQTLPAGTVLPAVVAPPASPSGLPAITVSLPDGTEVSFSAKLPHVPNAETPVSLKILPPEIKNAVTFRIHFSAPLPNVKEAAQALRPVQELQSAVVKTPAEPVRVQAFVLKSVPEQITALMPELNDAPAFPAQTADGKINIELRPDQNALPALGRQERPPLPPDVQNTPLPRPPATETTTIIELPKDVPPPPQIASPPNVAVKTESGETPSPLAQTAADLPAAGSFTAEKGQTPAPVLYTREIPVVPERVSPDAGRQQPPPAPEKNAAPAPIKPAAPDRIPSDRPAVSFPPEQKPPAAFFTRYRPAETNAPSVPESAVFRQNPPVLSAPVTVRGIVFHAQTEQRPLIATQIGVLAVEEEIQLPHLTPVSVKILPPPDTDFPAEVKAPLPEFKNSWTVLTDALDTLRRTDQAAYEAVRNILPQTGNKLPALMLSFMHAAAQGVSLTSFIGEANVSALRATERGERILKRLEKEFSASPKKATDGQNAWKGWDIPFLSGAVVEPVSLYLQRPNDGDPQRATTVKNGRGVRFVLDMNLTRLGKIQMEGLARRPERRFDLILRHQSDLPDDFDASVHDIFTQTLSALNYTGTIKVDQTDDFIVFTPHRDNETKRGVLV